MNCILLHIPQNVLCKPRTMTIPSSTNIAPQIQTLNFLRNLPSVDQGPEMGNTWDTRKKLVLKTSLIQQIFVEHLYC